MSNLMIGDIFLELNTEGCTGRTTWHRNQDQQNDFLGVGL